MERQQGRRGPLSGLMDRFSIDALRRESRQAEDKRNADIIARMKAEMHMQSLRHAQPSYRPVFRPTKRLLTIVRMERRAANKRARKARRRNRVA